MSKMSTREVSRVVLGDPLYESGTDFRGFAILGIPLGSSKTGQDGITVSAGVGVVWLHA
jgi:hypothetical protein